MFDWLTKVATVVTVASSLSVSTAGQLSSLPPQPTQNQVECHGPKWENKNLVALEDFQINKTLRPYIKKLLTDSRAAGAAITLNSVYRNCSEQGSLRASACGIGQYNLYIKPIIECTPPTEPAGRSLHNEGLAADLACQGYGLFEYSPCYQWLKTNHQLYQIEEHELEPWHWSTTGH